MIVKMISLVIILPDHSQVIGKNNLLKLLSNTGTIAAALPCAFSLYHGSG